MGSRLSVKPHHCTGCHNPETWPFEAGYEVDREDLLEEILEALDANGVHRNLSILGGEPLAPQNREDVLWLMRQIKMRRKTTIYLWTGYTYEQLEKEDLHIFENIDYLIEGPYIQEQRDITLKLRGSRNQRVFKHPDLPYTTYYMIIDPSIK